MHEDYKTRLANLSDKLTDIVLDEADPDNWPGEGKPLKEQTQQERGDRYWSKKNAAGSLTLLIKVHSLIGMQTRGGKPGEGGAPDERDFELGKQVAAAEREAMAVLDRIQKGRK
ncbi:MULTISPECIES: hypothetical protein [Yersinia]|uniref:Uncharacterized protein n=1 Tax=Yersinia intermedia TaxID=631 RepID=A0A0T9N0A2_YERIN|nr:MULTISPECIES: hypothetical protein [Yersinia]CNG65830.1 Uncharacterised protein [Yersinia intermedia]CNK10394.1 Uncharacterised protein [Yersinia aldovae]